ncbi:MAG: glutaredoxin [Elusimicrobia bacterium CG1_02_63_36]|nr:MAG: glutaredoxin [Elusimicrobia bacterium CG1_02_63_36]PIP84683.1 MAG: glutaredoxin [Elusimicrobia bacterium CG22_combo_CG10-13_8_21_14_all_63_91]PJA13237.1 MAG: glutaredoxin [Elusimicrobia bacterium CG_4_10_14_0_2_um_filter_63_34]PJB24451.1 MAG: glutaredoxin [Elusimicrobia bacterium CG_4_9_14_3_um_filter_62_55]
MPKRKIEVFTAGCPVCDEAVKTVQAAACPNCEVVIYDLIKGCATNECRDKAKTYRIKRLPAVAVDGKLIECCKQEPVSVDALRAVGVGRF